MKKTGKIVKTVVFLALILLINAVMQYALVPSSYMRINFHNVRENKYDDIFIGTSHGFCGIDPVKVDEVTGRRSTNLCMPNEFLQDSYYIVKEVLRHQKPERIIYELDPGYWVTENNTGHAEVFIYDNMPWSPVKLQYGLDKLGAKDFRASLFLWHYYRSSLNLSEICSNLQNKQSKAYKEYREDQPSEDAEYYKGEGFLSHPRGAGENKQDTNLVLWDEQKVNEVSLEYFEKLAAYCRKEKIELIAVALPIPEETTELYQDAYGEAYAYYEELMEQYEVDYYNFNTIKDAEIDRNLEDFYDYDGHMFADTAEAFSLVLGKYLKTD